MRRQNSFPNHFPPRPLSWRPQFPPIDIFHFNPEHVGISLASAQRVGYPDESCPFIELFGLDLYGRRQCPVVACGQYAAPMKLRWRHSESVLANSGIIEFKLLRESIILSKKFLSLFRNQGHPNEIK